MQPTMNGLRLDASTTLWRHGLQRVLPTTSSITTFHRGGNSTLALGLQCGYPNMLRRIACQSQEKRQETRDLPPAANVGVGAIIGQFAFPMLLSLVCCNFIYMNNAFSRMVSSALFFRGSSCLYFERTCLEFR